MTRKIQPVSFNLDDVYERKLREYAMEQNKYFSKYVKWLIEQDRSRKLSNIATKPLNVVVKDEDVSFGKSSAKGFL